MRLEASSQPEMRKKKKMEKKKEDMVFLLTASLLSALMFVSSVFTGGSLRETLHSQNQRNVTAEPGRNVTLPCRAPASKPVVAVEWSRADLGSEYVLLYRNDQIDSEDQHPSFKNRVDLQDRELKDGDVSLVLKNTTTDDRGTYQCQVVQLVINSRMETVFIIYLDVRPPPGEPKGGKNYVIVGLVVGTLVPAVIIVVVGYWIHKKRSGTRPSEEPEEQPEHQDSLMAQNGPGEL